MLLCYTARLTISSKLYLAHPVTYQLHFSIEKICKRNNSVVIRCYRRTFEVFESEV